jgi:hypothetical protein
MKSIRKLNNPKVTCIFAAGGYVPGLGKERKMEQPASGY